MNKIIKGIFAVAVKFLLSPLFCFPAAADSTRMIFHLYNDNAFMTYHHQIQLRTSFFIAHRKISQNYVVSAQLFSYAVELLLTAGDVTLFKFNV